MSAASTGRDWAAMSRAEFDQDAAVELPISAGPVRIPAAPDEFGTQPLFGEPVPAPQPRPARALRPGDIDGQDELF
ncbi:hypothetical protein [Streptomyces noursei]|uniref:hypothetical protein n=1 Tax=Streptomyces noursei TaxID=1971 RepID=UPI0019AD54F9|nr:hypothetical protein [Streptomyces noursei]MCZ1019847.1 hypothetical protein [Streptomyces noursei]GGX36271.1 hypothetical protein GCM10010341_67130 [Streptomyces noursei]